MGTSQKYSLRWNDFSLNVATTFRDLHSQQVSGYYFSHCNNCYKTSFIKKLFLQNDSNILENMMVKNCWTENTIN